MKKAIKIIVAIVIILITVLVYNAIVEPNQETELIEITSQEELEKIYEGEEDTKSILSKILTLPFSILDEDYSYSSTKITNKTTSSKEDISSFLDTATTNTAESSVKQSSSKEYSTTNIQVENVDEADITKTDGDYIYSLSEDNVIITDVKDPTQIKIVSRLTKDDSNTIPEDIILYNDKLVVIYQKVKNWSLSYYYSYNRNNTTIVSVYDITNKEEPKEIKNYELEQPYYTSRCIDGKLYVIASGELKEENDSIITYYKEDGKQIDPGYKGMRRIKDLETTSLTVLSMIDLNNLEDSVKVNSYLMDVENAYISENNIYLLDEKYKGYSYGVPTISSIFGWKGIFGAFDEENEEVDAGYYTQIHKFNLLNDGTIKYDKKAEEKGKTINQFSIDEYENNLRIALYDNDGSKIVIFDENMKKIGETEKLAEGEKMYSSRFLGNKAYLVTYKTIDPLFVVDLSNPENPKALGELKIPGYSTYLHPYDENHIIGIGMQTEEKVNRDSSGKVTSTSAVITGMKMALFDVTDMENPIQISDTIIGDKKTTSAILTNHKALLFSKEKQLLAIPVNNYSEDFEITNSTDTYSSITSSYASYSKDYIAEGYLVYNINLEEGFKLKGTITHQKNKSKYSYSNSSRLLRGLYIEDNLYTISEDYIKVNKLEDLEEISQLKIKED